MCRARAPIGETRPKVAWGRFGPGDQPQSLYGPTPPLTSPTLAARRLADRFAPSSRDVAVLVVATVALRMRAFLASRHLTFDDGNFGASAVALRHGEAPFSEVFSSQGPLFLPLVWLADLVGWHTLSAPRLLSLAGV